MLRARGERDERGLIARAASAARPRASISTSSSSARVQPRAVRLVRAPARVDRRRVAQRVDRGRGGRGDERPAAPCERRDVERRAVDVGGRRDDGSPGVLAEQSEQVAARVAGEPERADRDEREDGRARREPRDGAAHGVGVAQAAVASPAVEQRKERVAPRAPRAVVVVVVLVVLARAPPRPRARARARRAPPRSARRAPPRPCRARRRRRRRRAAALSPSTSSSVARGLSGSRACGGEAMSHADATGQQQAPHVVRGRERVAAEKDRSSEHLLLRQPRPAQRGTPRSDWLCGGAGLPAYACARLSECSYLATYRPRSAAYSHATRERTSHAKKSGPTRAKSRRRPRAREELRAPLARPRCRPPRASRLRASASASGGVVGASTVGFVVAAACAAAAKRGPSSVYMHLVKFIVTESLDGLL